MTDGLVITFAAFHLERQLLLAALVRDDIGHDARARNGRRAHREFVAADHEHAVKRERFARFRLQTFDSNVSPAATRYCLPPVSNTAYINLFPRKGSGIKPDFRGLSTPVFLVNWLVPRCRNCRSPPFSFTGQQFFPRTKPFVLGKFRQSENLFS